MRKPKMQDIKAVLKPNAQKLSLLFLYLYFVFVFIGQYITDISVDLKTWMVLLLLAGAVIATTVTDKISQTVLRISTGKIGTQKELTIWFLLCFVCTFGILERYYYAFFPGSYSPDSNLQLYQAVSGNYSDWHPFIHTFLFFTIPIKLFQSIEMIVFLQIMYFSVALAYLIMTLRKYGCPRKLCVFSLCLVLFSPITGNILMYPWKDCGMAIFAMVTMAHYINVLLSKGEWLRRKRNIVVCSLFFALTTLVRHNAILFTLPMLAALAVIGWRAYKRQVMSMILIFAALLFLVKVPMYHLYKVEKPGERTVETMGMCMVMMGNVLENCPEKLDSEVKSFLYQVSPKEVWEQNYVTGDFNNVKWSSETDTAVIEEAGAQKLLKYTFQTFRASGIYSLQAFLKLTGMVWKIDGDLVWYVSAFPDTDKTQLVLDVTEQKKVRMLLQNWTTLVYKSVLKYPMNYIGWFDLALIALALISVRKKETRIHIFHALPLLCYNFGTALLLTGFDWRFFYLNFPLVVPTIFLLVKSMQEAEK